MYINDNKDYNDRMFGHAASEFAAARAQGVSSSAGVMRVLKHVFKECQGGLKARMAWRDFRNAAWEPVCHELKNGGDFKAALKEFSYK